MNRINGLVLTAALGLALCSIPASFFTASSLAQPGQQDPSGTRKPACGCFICGDLAREASRKGINLPFNFVEFEDKKPDCAGILAEDACPRELAQIPKETREKFCQQIKAGLKFTSFKDSCPVLAASCEPDDKTPPPEKKCEKPTPWFEPSSDCSDVQNQVVAINAGAVTLSICGSPIFRWVPPDNDPLLIEAYQRALRDWVKTRVGSKICCDKFREAARTGTPCYPAVDVDCDGKPNQSDIHTESSGTTFPDINNMFSKPEGTPVDPFPVGLDPDDSGFLPPPEKCDCKWELVKGTLNCSPDGNQRHFYEARWRCPSTGNERYTRKYAAATAPCP